MNQHPGVIGLKLGMTQVFLEDGSVVPCTVIESRPVVVAKRTHDKHGYDALVIGLGERHERHTNKPLAGQYKKANVTPKRMLRELRCNAQYAAQFEVGQVVPLDKVFEVGQFVDVQGVSRGRGFSGVMRRHNFKGAVATHGSHEYKRHGGAIGSNMTPGRTLPGLGMPGQHGNRVRSVLNQRIARVIPEEDLILVQGGAPGARNGVVVVRGATKRWGGKPKAAS
ncbi:MAG: 50S ribosomal protein L3 [Polyangiaceae bacterium]|nr:50S ribosomal protein L3 [Polyangiaceae bacterium]